MICEGSRLLSHKVAGGKELVDCADCPRAVFLWHSFFFLVEASQEPTVWTFILQLLAFLCSMPTTATVEAPHCLDIWFLGSEGIYFGIICPLWVLYLHLSTKVLLCIGFIWWLSYCATREKGIGFEGLGDFPYFCQYFIDDVLLDIGMKEFKVNAWGDLVFEQLDFHGCVDLWLMVEWLSFCDEGVDIEIPLAKIGDFIFGPVNL